MIELEGQSRLHTVAYFSMEVAVDPQMPTYAGGLGILAGDTLRAAADLGAPIAGVTLLHRKGYFRQHLDTNGNQTEGPSIWSPENALKLLPHTVSVFIEGREVHICVWLYIVRGVGGYEVPVYFLDTMLPENTPWDQSITDYLYGGDEHYRLCQEIVLGVGGVLALRKVTKETPSVYHMNEGHAAFATIALLQERIQERGASAVTEGDKEFVREQCVFTTHTPVPAGQDKFPIELVRRVMSEELWKILESADCFRNDTVNMTYLALYFSRYINGVAMHHSEISHTMFPNYPINSITNGVHAYTWTSPPFRALYDKHIPEWRGDSMYLRYAIGIPLEEIRDAHRQAKQALLDEVEKRSGVKLKPEAMTIGFARRAAAYKRADLVFSDIERLKRIARDVGSFQMIFGGKAHPQDEGGKEIIRNIFKAARELGDAVPVVYLEEYDMELAKLLCSGVDLWLNTPQKPQEASGTSGMKATLNGVPNFSVLDGWWIEGHVDGETGWSITDDMGADENLPPEVFSLYHKLEHVILPMFYGKPEEYESIMRTTIALNGSFFNARRMLNQYLDNAYPIRKKYERHD